MVYVMKLILLFIFAPILVTMTPFSTVSAQSEKNEVERSIDREDMPTRVLTLIDEF